MAEYVLTITPRNCSPFAVKLSTSAPDSVAENKFLYCDWKYSLELKLGGAKNIYAHVNGEPAELSGRIFNDCYGFAQISFVVELENGRVLKLHSEFLPVLVKNLPLNNSVREMVNFISENCAEFLYDGDLKSRARAARKKSSATTIEERLRLVKISPPPTKKITATSKSTAASRLKKSPRSTALKNFSRLRPPRSSISPPIRKISRRLKVQPA